jgi:DNA-binding NtrC family response regulator
MGTIVTEPVDPLPAGVSVQRFELRVVEGPLVGKSWTSSGDRCSVGSHDSNDLVIDDKSVSRFHCEVGVGAKGCRLRDLGSLNGTIVDGVQVDSAYLRQGSLIRIGRTVLRLSLTSSSNWVPVPERSEFGSLVGASVVMREALGMLARAAESDATILIVGETGTGKEGAAASVHEASARRDKPLVIVDCSAVPPDLLESELFGHEKGAFTGAQTRRIGAFEEAAGGTVFLDEIGELPLDLQPKLLRVLEQRHFRRVGSNAYNQTDVRIIAATNRDLRAEVNQQRFRSDLYYRLAVVTVRLPPLRERPEDIPLLAARILAMLGGGAEDFARFGTPEFIAAMQRSAWPGNVRELRNYLERCLLFRQPLDTGDPSLGPPTARSDAADEEASYVRARRRNHDQWELRYLQTMLARHQGNVEQAAQAAGVARQYIYRLMRRHNLRPPRAGG